jgi:glyoxylate reductase
MSARPRVFATRRLPGGALERLAGEAELSAWTRPGRPSAAELAEAARDADGLLCLLTDRVDAALLGACPRLRAISSMSVGLDHVDLAAASARRIPVGFTPGVLAETTADLAFALLLAAARRLGEAERWLRRGEWTEARRWEPDLLLGRDVHGATLGVVGLGAIGLAVARRAAGFGMRVLGWSRRPRPEAAALGIESVALAELLARADFVTLHVALTPETRHLIDAAALARMQPGAILVNTSRGEVVDESALADALRSGRLGAAGLDVFEREPLPASSPLLALENAVLLPHLGSASVATRVRMAELAVENLRAALAGRPMPRCANPGVYEG